MNTKLIAAMLLTLLAGQVGAQAPVQVYGTIDAGLSLIHI